MKKIILLSSLIFSSLLLVSTASADTSTRGCETNTMKGGIYCNWTEGKSWNTNNTNTCAVEYGTACPGNPTGGTYAFSCNVNSCVLSCNSGYTLCTGACHANVAVPGNCTAFDQCTDTCSACAAGYALLGNTCSNAIVQLGADSIGAANTIVQSSSPILSINGLNIGIGTTTPTAKLVVVPASGYSILAGGFKIGSVAIPTADTDVATKAYVDSAGGSMPSGTSGQTLRHNGTSWLANSVLFNNGTNIGIGTTTPAAKLSVVGSIELSGGAWPQVGYNSSTDGMAFGLLDPAGIIKGAYFNVFGQDAGSATQRGSAEFVVDTRTNTSAGFNIYNYNGSTWTPRFTVLGSGNVGVGVTNPNYRLDVQGGQINASGGLCIAGVCQTSWATGGVGTGWATSSTHIYNTNSGNVGIGTTTPGATLSINTAAISGRETPLRVAVSDASGYVFGVKNSTATAGIFEPAFYGTAAAADRFGLLFQGMTTSAYDSGADPLLGFFAQIYAGDPVTGTFSNPTSRNLFAWGNNTGFLMSMDKSGNLGIGTTTPTAKLSIAPTTGYAVLAGGYKMGNLALPTVSTDAATKGYVDSVATSSGSLPAGVSGQTLRHDGSTWIANSILFNNGTNIGIGTTTPIATLDIVAGASSGISEGFESATFPPTSGTWTTGGNSSWARSTSVYYAGAASAAAGAIADSQSTYLDIDYTFPSSGSISFYWNVSSEANYDYLFFCIDNDACTSASGYDSRISGTVGWTQVTVAVAAGAHSFRWVYSKDSGAIGGSDKGWVDNVVLDTGAAARPIINAQSGGSSVFNVSNTGLSYFSGNLGIGTTNPTARLEIIPTSGYAIFAGNYKIGNVATPTADTDAATKAYVDSSISGSGGLPSGTSGQTLRHDGSGWVANSVLFNNGTNIGIGTTSPVFKLDLNGQINASGGLCIAGVCQTSWTSGAAGTGWATSSTHIYNTNSGNVGIGITNPTSKLNIVGTVASNNSITATSFCLGVDCIVSWPTGGGSYLPLAGGTMAGAINMNSNDITNVNNLTVSKITATTIDPLYKIRGINYSTFAPSVVGGVKEEITGKVRLATRNKLTGEYEASIDFSDVKEGSDLWVWRQVIDFNAENVDVFITPYGRQASTYYVINGNELIFRADVPADISYRLIGRRFDWRAWPTRANDQSEQGVVIK